MLRRLVLSLTRGGRHKIAADELQLETRRRQRRERFARLRQLRQQVQDIQTLLSRIQAGDGQLEDHAPAIVRGRDAIEHLVAGLVEDVSNNDVEKLEVMGHIETVWHRMVDNPILQHPQTATRSKALIRSVASLDADSREIVYQIGWWTIPERLDDWLAGSRTGYYVPFHAVFDDELPLESDRIRILNNLAVTPRAISLGLVDSEHGLIYRFTQNRLRRWGEFLIVIATPFVVAALIAYLANPSNGIAIGQDRFLSLKLPDWPLSRGGDHTTELVAGWFAVIAGVVVHGLVEYAKRLQSTSVLPMVVSPSNLLRWNSAFWGRTTLRVLQALIAFFGVAFTQDLGKASYLEFFLAGYALDSVLGLIGASLDRRSGIAISTLKRQLE